MTIKTIFLDRDGVINKEKKYLYKISDFTFIDGVFSACRYFINQGFQIIIVSNQSGIARGFYNEKDFDILTKWMLEEFDKNKVKILDIFHCPHAVNSNCNCRKPKPGMIIKAQNLYQIELSNSWMIGDKEDDIQTANNAGLENTILVRSGHKIDETSTRALHILDSIKQSVQIIN
jgi:D-glycero-D-manno-heptose 1,7-bisphosphate phosphatase